MICLHHDSISQGIIPTQWRNYVLCLGIQPAIYKSYSFLITNFIMSKSKRTKGQEIYLYLFSYNVVQHDSYIRLCLYRLKVTRRCH
jgi:hypothetical protein